ncbi:MAG TPA: ribosome-associated translation inhibitor RaiA [Gemmatimonadota bacterium]|nr:ribosome-associated translation inhibitor RaiA [Gemmatimonadota bacterium]
MQITLSVRHGDAPEPLKQHAQSEVEGLARYFERLVEADIVLDQEGHRHIAEIRIHSSNDTHFASTEAEDWRSAVDGTIDKLRRQLKRHKEKLIRRPMSHAEREVLYGAGGEDGGRGLDGVDSASESAAPPEWDRISSREAIARLEISAEDVLVFVDALDGVVKIARRANDGSIQVVEAEAYELEK